MPYWYWYIFILPGCIASHSYYFIIFHIIAAFIFRVISYAIFIFHYFSHFH
jgi:hypothetical protein